MKLVIIYGPPAAGKLTVATELAEQTGYKLFHNHVSIDCVKPVFDFGTPPFVRLVEMIRNETFAEAARENVSVIHTFVYAFGIDDDYFQRKIASVEDNGGEVCLVLLRCDDDIRRERIVHESRVRIGKLTDPDSIELSRQKHDLFSPLPGRESLIIDTAEVKPEEASSRIIEHYGLMDLKS